MTPAVFAALGWVILANVIGMFPSPKRHHWPAAYGLIAVGIPLAVWLYIEAGGWALALFVLAAVSILRWPVRFLLRWLRRMAGGAVPPRDT